MSPQAKVLAALEAAMTANPGKSAMQLIVDAIGDIGVRPIAMVTDGELVAALEGVRG